jgi:hypothetical protein
LQGDPAGSAFFRSRQLLNRNDVADAAGFGGKPPQKPALEISNIWLNQAGGNSIAKTSVTIPRWGETLHSCSVVCTAPGKYWLSPRRPR